MMCSITKSCREVEVEKVVIGGFVSVDWQKCGHFHGARGDTAGLNGTEIGE